MASSTIRPEEEFLAKLGIARHKAPPYDPETERYDPDDWSEEFPEIRTFNGDMMPDWMTPQLNYAKRLGEKDVFFLSAGPMPAALITADGLQPIIDVANFEYTYDAVENLVKLTCQFKENTERREYWGVVRLVGLKSPSSLSDGGSDEYYPHFGLFLWGEPFLYSSEYSFEPESSSSSSSSSSESGSSSSKEKEDSSSSFSYDCSCGSLCPEEDCHHWTPGGCGGGKTLCEYCCCFADRPEGYSSSDEEKTDSSSSRSSGSSSSSSEESSSSSESKIYRFGDMKKIKVADNDTYTFSIFEYSGNNTLADLSVVNDITIFSTQSKASYIGEPPSEDSAKYVLYWKHDTPPDSGMKKEVASSGKSETFYTVPFLSDSEALVFDFPKDVIGFDIDYNAQYNSLFAIIYHGHVTSSGQYSEENAEEPEYGFPDIYGGQLRLVALNDEKTEIVPLLYKYTLIEETSSDSPSSGNSSSDSSSSDSSSSGSSSSDSSSSDSEEVIMKGWCFDTRTGKIGGSSFSASCCCPLYDINDKLPPDDGPCFSRDECSKVVKKLYCKPGCQGFTPCGTCQQLVWSKYPVPLCLTSAAPDSSEESSEEASSESSDRYAYLLEYVHSTATKTIMLGDNDFLVFYYLVAPFDPSYTGEYFLGTFNGWSTAGTTDVINPTDHRDVEGVLCWSRVTNGRQLAPAQPVPVLRLADNHVSFLFGLPGQTSDANALEAEYDVATNRIKLAGYDGILRGMTYLSFLPDRIFLKNVPVPEPEASYPANIVPLLYDESDPPSSSSSSEESFSFSSESEEPPELCCPTLESLTSYEWCAVIETEECICLRMDEEASRSSVKLDDDDDIPDEDNGIIPNTDKDIPDGLCQWCDCKSGYVPWNMDGRGKCGLRDIDEGCEWVEIWVPVESPCDLLDVVLTPPAECNRTDIDPTAGCGLWDLGKYGGDRDDTPPVEEIHLRGYKCEWDDSDFIQRQDYYARVAGYKDFNDMLEHTAKCNMSDMNADRGGEDGGANLADNLNQGDDGGLANDVGMDGDGICLVADCGMSDLGNGVDKDEERPGFIKKRVLKCGF